jgi:HD-like signal output (HDOD) protein/ActR/RegA family two-component response regulator
MTGGVMTRILFVDDEPRVLDGLRRTLRGHRARWEMSFALGGEAALAELARAEEARERYDVLVTDMRMPDVDGLALLTAARRRWPEMVRVVLSGYMDMETAVRSSGAAHQFLAKPCDPGALEAVITRTRQVGELLSDPAIRSAVGEVGALAACPALYAELERIVADPAAGVVEVAAVVERDVSLTPKVLQLVNSSFFGIPRRVGTVEHAVAYLGVSVIRALVLAHEIAERAGARGLAPGFSLARHHEHALRVASLARLVAGGSRAADDAFLGGVLHDLGELLLAAQRPDWLAASAAHAARHRLPLHEAEAALFGVSHAEVGAYLVGLWGLPLPIVEAVAFHHVPSRAGGPAEPGVLAAVHVAAALVAEAGPSGVAAGTPALLDLEYVDRTGLGAQLDAWREAAAAQVTAPDAARHLARPA